jgi:hypothetical protein
VYAWRMFRAGALVAVALIATLSLAAAQGAKPLQQPVPNPAAANAQEPQRGTENAPVAVKLMNTGESDAVAAENKKRQDGKDAFDREIASKAIYLNIGLVLVGIIQAIAIFYTAIVTNKAASAANMSAKAAIVQLRAFVGIDSVSLENVGNGLIPRAVITFKNTGLSPAFNVAQTGVMGVDYWPVPRGSPDLGGPISRESQPLGPGTEIYMPIELPRALQEHHIVALQDNTMALYVFGTMSFADAFGEKHSYKFAVYSNREGGMNDGRMAAFIGDPKIT